jgi:hypothetical protein
MIEILINKKKKDFHSTCSIMVLNLSNMKLETCNRPSTRRLWNLIGNWEINSTCVKEVGNNPEKLGVCDFHFNQDQTPDFHQTGLKQNINTTSALISYKRCLYCNYNFHIFTRGKNCKAHAWRLIGKDIILPCITLYTCNTLMTHESIACEKLSYEKCYGHSRYICQTCFTKNGGHIYSSPGQGKKRTDCTNAHNNEYEMGLRIIGNWILNVASSSDEELKQKLLSKLSHSLTVYWKNDHLNNSDQLYKKNSNSDFVPIFVNPPSIFIINTCLKLGKANKLAQKRYEKILPDDSFEFGQNLGQLLLSNNKLINENKEKLESPSSLTEYFEALPQIIVNFFCGLVGVLLSHHHKIAEKQWKKRNLQKHVSLEYNDQQSKILEYNNQKSNPIILTCIVSFLASIILTIAFKGKKFWITYLLSSICRRPKFLTFLQEILQTVHVIAHTQRHERHLEYQRMNSVIPCKNLLSGSHIWNLAIIDNIDFMQKSF